VFTGRSAGNLRKKNSTTGKTAPQRTPIHMNAEYRLRQTAGEERSATVLRWPYDTKKYRGHEGKVSKKGAGAFFLSRRLTGTGESPRIAKGDVGETKQSMSVTRSNFERSGNWYLGSRWGKKGGGGNGGRDSLHFKSVQPFTPCKCRGERHLRGGNRGESSSHHSSQEHVTCSI